MSQLSTHHVDPSDGSNATRRREPFWDVLRAAAIARVIAWHTWMWTPLSWVAAMPAMFLVAGALLRDSVHRHGYRHTIGTRLRRLLLPFWAYSAVAVTTMLVVGWRPERSDMIGWIVPLVDPIGSDEAPGLWIPLWYLRAYLWFVILAGLLVVAARRLGWWLPVLFGGFLGIQQSAAPGLDLAVVDFIAYGIFVAAGMVIADRQRFPSASTAASVALVAGVAATGIVVSGRASAVVNASYTVTVLVGVMTVGVAIALARAVRSVARGRSGLFVDWIGRRALTIYLWHGMGLFAADRLVTQRGIDGAVGAIASGIVVVGATAILTAAFGWVEDVAARRDALTGRALALATPAAAVVIVIPSLVIVPPTDATATPPPSGLAVLATADEIELQLEVGSATTLVVEPATASVDASARDISEITDALAAVLEEHAAEHIAVLERNDIGFIELVAIPPGGPTISLRWEPDSGAVIDHDLQPISWYSITKSATAIWLMTLVQDGVVSLDDPLQRFLPEVGADSEITLEQLARHRGGIPASADTSIAEYERLLRPDSNGLDIGNDIRTWLATSELTTEPGDAFVYSRVGYGLLAWALERAAGNSWQAAMRGLAAEAGVTLVIDEELAAPGVPNHHPGEGDYRGSAWAGGGLVSSPIDLVEFFHWAFTEGLDRSSVNTITAASPERTLAYFAIGLTIRCPCIEEGDVLRGTRVGNGGSNGWWQHEIASGTTLMLSPERAISENGIVMELHDADFQAALFDAIRG